MFKSFNSTIYLITIVILYLIYTSFAINSNFTEYRPKTVTQHIDNLIVICALLISIFYFGDVKFTIVSLGVCLIFMLFFGWLQDQSFEKVSSLSDSWPPGHIAVIAILFIFSSITILYCIFLNRRNYKYLIRTALAAYSFGPSGSQYELHHYILFMLMLLIIPINKISINISTGVFLAIVLQGTAAYGPDSFFIKD